MHDFFALIRFLELLENFVRHFLMPSVDNILNVLYFTSYSLKIHPYIEMRKELLSVSLDRLSEKITRSNIKTNSVDST